MLRLTLLLCGTMLLALIIFGEDRGQLRPGLAEAARQAAQEAERAALAPPEPPLPEPPPPVLATAPDLFEPPPEVAAAEPPPYVEPEREPVAALEEPVFSLANLGNEPVPGENGAPPVADEPLVPAPDLAAEVPADPPTDPESQPATGTVWTVAANSVNLRATPSTDADILTKLGQGEAVVLVATVDDEWAQIIVQNDGLVGYVAMSYLSPAAQ